MTPFHFSKRKGWRNMLLLGGLATVVVFLVIASFIFFRPPKPLDNLLENGFVRELTGYKLGLLQGSATDSTGTTKIKKTVREDGSFFYTKIQPGGKTLTTDFDIYGAFHSVKGTIKLTDGRTIFFDREYGAKNDAGQVVIVDRSVIVDSWGRELHNDLVETLSNTGRTLSVKGVIRNSSGREYMVNRTYSQAP